MKANNEEKNDNNKTIYKVAHDDVIDRSVVLPATTVPQCGVCEESVFNESLQSEVWPFFCIKCENWYHHKCMPLTTPPNSGVAICPQCSTGDFIQNFRFYCNKCGHVEIKENTFWPNALCAKCGEKGFIAVLTDNGSQIRGLGI